MIRGRSLSRVLASIPLVLLHASVRGGDAPKGEVLPFVFDRSAIFPGTVRDYWIYVPRQYDPTRPACLYVNQDGIQYNAPAVFDELIHRQEMPVTIGVFVMHGKVKALSPQALDRFNRSYEYDGLGDSYVRFLLEELLPEVERKTTTDGRPIRLSRDPNDRAIGGSSSGAVCAFTAAWERPDAFRRVFSSIGTYYGSANTASTTGQIIGIPDFEWGPAIHGDGLTSALLYNGGTSGVWEAGIACANSSGVVTDYWNTEITFTSSNTDPDGFVWADVPGLPTDTPEVATTVVLPLVGVGILGSGLWFSRRRSTRKAALAVKTSGP